jgi:signal transduction histidine kinase
MAALGQLVAGVAHEINTPIGAIRAAASNLNKSLPITIQTLPNVLKLLSDEEVKLFIKMVERSLNFDGQLTSREERQYKKDMTSNLEAAGIVNASAMASDLVKIGLFDKYDEFMPIFKNEHAKEIVEMVGALGKLRVNLSNIDTAVSKTQKIVFALKSYSHKSFDEKPEPVNIIDNIETVLTIYNNQLKHGVTVVKNMDESLPMVMGLPDELNQVWTNIIHNSIQAMENKGTITIDVFKENNMACIRLADNGPGIPEEYQKKIFEAFFTTKRQGEGSGLGLDICRKIIEKHKGSLILEESRPGRTAFLVKIPITQAIN